MFAVEQRLRAKSLYMDGHLPLNGCGIRYRGGYTLGIVAKDLPEYWYGSKLITEDEFWNDIDCFYDEDTFIYIAYPFASKEYKEAKAKLEAIGLNEFSDFFGSESYGRKMVIINANCHVIPYEKYLLASKEFCEKYYIYPIDPIQNRMPVEIPDILLRNCDVFIHQAVSINNSYSRNISDEYIYSLLKEECCKIIVPNFANGEIRKYNRFLFPQLGGSNLNHPRMDYIKGVFPFQDLIIDECLYRGLAIDTILYCYRDEKLIPEQVIKERYEEYLAVFKKEEERWDVKISDFLILRKKKILASPMHPAEEVLAEIGKRILRLLEIEENVPFDFEYADEYPILACVSKALGIERCKFIRDGDSILRMEDVLCNRRMDLEEYVIQYIYWVHEYEINRLLFNIFHTVQGRNYILFQPTGYVRQLINIRKEPIKDTLEDYQHGVPVVILLDLDAKIKVRNCIDVGVRAEDIYIIETRDYRKFELSNMIYEYPKVILYGMGNDFKYLIDHENDKIAVCDKKIAEDCWIDGIEYITIDTLINKYRETLVYVTSTRYGTEIQEDLYKKGFRKEKIILNKICIEKIDMHLSKAAVLPLRQSMIGMEYFQ